MSHRHEMRLEEMIATALVLTGLWGIFILLRALWRKATR